MRVAAIAGLLACTVFVLANSSSVSAEPLDLLKLNQQPASRNLLSYAQTSAETTTDIPVPIPPPKPEPKIHEIKDSETLSSIAEQHGTTWVRIFNKNTQIIHPDIINVGDKLTIPLADEQLADRPLPEPPQPVVAETPAAPVARSGGNPAVASATTTVSRGPSAGNTYTAGYCTWYAKNMRPDLPNNLGHADTWVARAAAQGLPTGSAPQAGAIGQQGMHVVYVQSVNGDGTVNISEMNYKGLYVISTRTVPASSFRYIY